MTELAQYVPEIRRVLKRANDAADQYAKFKRDVGGIIANKVPSRRDHQVTTNLVRMNADGTIDRRLTANGEWQRIDNGADHVTPWFLLSQTNGRDHGVFAATLATAFRHKTNRAKFRVEVDLVYAGVSSMPDPAHPGDTTKMVRITNAYLSNLHRNRGKTMWLNQNSLHMMNTHSHRYQHPAARYGVAQGLHARLRVKAVEGGTPTPLKDTLNPGNLLKVAAVCHYAGI